MQTELHDPSTDLAPETNPFGPGAGPGGGVGGNPNPRDPAWGDIIGGIWDRLTDPLPG